MSGPPGATPQQQPARPPHQPGHNWTCLATVPELSHHFDGQSVTLAAPVGKLLLMSRFEPQAPGARLTGQGEARRLPDPPRSPAVWRIPPKWTNLIPALAGFLFSDPLAHITRLIRSRPVGRPLSAALHLISCRHGKPARQCARSCGIRQQLLGYQGCRGWLDSHGKSCLWRHW